MASSGVIGGAHLGSNLGLQFFWSLSNSELAKASMSRALAGVGGLKKAKVAPATVARAARRDVVPSDDEERAAWSFPLLPGRTRALDWFSGVVVAKDETIKNRIKEKWRMVLKKGLFISRRDGVDGWV